MRAVPPRAAASDPAPYAAAEAAFAKAKAYLCSREAQQMSESDIERELHRRGRELMRTLLQGHLDQRSPGEAAGPVAGADGVERSERRVHERHIETTFGTVQVERLGYARPGHDSLHPLDAALNAPYLHYDRYLAAGYPIATGVIEGACRYLVRDRMDLTGARWRLVGAEAVLKLRALRASGDFDAYWDFHEAREYERNHAQRYAARTAPPVSEPPPRPLHHVFDASSSSCHAARRSPLGRRRRRAAPRAFWEKDSRI